MKVIFVLWIALLGLCGPVEAQQKVVCASVGQWPPIEFLDDDGNMTGYTAELLQAAGRRSGLEIEFLDVDETEIVERLLAGEYDAICSSMLNETLHQEKLDFSEPYLHVQQTLVIHAKKKIFGNTDWSGKRFGARKNTTGAVVIKTIGGIPQEYDTISRAMEGVFLQRLDGVVCDQPVADYYARVKYNNKLREAYFGSSEKPVSVAVKKGDRELLQKLNKGIAKVKVMGIDLELKQKWFSR